MSKLLIGGEWVAGATNEVLRDKFDGEPFAEMGVASDEQIDAAVEGALEGFRAHKLDPDERFRILSKAAELVLQRRGEFIEIITRETGFTHADGDGEVKRCAQTLVLSAEEAKRLNGDVVPFDAVPGLKNRMGFTIRVPRGVVCAITPYNSPLNTVAHKIGPALAAGNAVVLKPSEYSPLTASLLCKALLDAGLPPRLLALVHGTGQQVGQRLLDDQRVAFYTFTGSTRVGRVIQQAAGLRGTQLELGSIASTIVCHDADLDLVMKKLPGACFRKAGQVCTSVQRMFVDRRIMPQFTDRFLAAAARLPVGNPHHAETVVGPMISLQQAERAEAWIAEAVAQGAEVLMGNRREGPLLYPTVLRNVNPEMRVSCQEIFAPVVSLVEFDSIDDAIAQSNATPYGLAAGIFTSNLHTAMKAANALEFGGVHINETSSSRVDLMPFGGVKDSGFGKEGPRYAMREMMLERLVTMAY
jgi:acyl-CoA reductase-like NAD-dependent aldehyde dehydrogenase